MFMRNKENENYTEQISIWLLLLALLGIVLSCFSGGISGNDFWWHVKVGEYIFEEGSVPTTGIFSWVGMEKGIEWTAHEWLSELIFYCIHNILGDAGIYFFP